MTHRTALKDHSRESSLFASRAIIAFIVVLLLLSILLSRAFYLQVSQHSELSTQSDENRIHLQSLAPTRGLIYDTKGRLLAKNKPTYTLVLIKERIKDLDATFETLRSLIPISDAQIEKYKKRARRARPFESVSLRFRLTEEEIARIAVNEFSLPGVEVEAQLVRHYPQGSKFAHSLGYVGRINDRDLKKIDAERYSGTDTLGKIGVERYYENLLLGQPGYQEVETDARGRVQRVLGQELPEPGRDLTLYLDVELQEVAIQALGEHRGAVVAIDTNTGGIIVMASTPSYDPNPFVTGISTKAYSALRNSSDRPLYNRASLGEYPPASTIKQFIAIAALNEKVVSPSYSIFDPGWFQLPGEERLYRNWKKTGHGKVNMEKAIMYSNDTYFYGLALKLGIDRIHDYMSSFGFGQRVGLDVAEERPGLMPSREWKKAVRGQPWYPGETVISGIGQGFMLATPLQLAAGTTLLANRGHWVAPRLLKSVEGAEAEFKTSALGDISLESIKTWALPIEAMRKVVHHPRGTAHYRIGRDIKYQMAGKTGTAQVVGIKQDEEYDAEKLALIHRDHGLFVGFAPVENPQIAIAVVVENGGGGSSAAAPVARKVLDAYMLPLLEAALEAKALNNKAKN